MNIGDRAKVTVEGTITQIWSGVPHFDLDTDDGRDYMFNSVTDEVEVIKPPVEVFKEGDIVVPIDQAGYKYFVGARGYYSFSNQKWFDYPNGSYTFTSEHYERVNNENT